MEPRDLTIRNATYSLFVELGRAPTAQEVAGSAELDTGEVVASWKRLHDQHALVLNRATAEIRMANPFSAVVSAYRIRAANRWWYANCAWDALGICAALHVDGRVEASCPDCGEPISVTVTDSAPDDGGLSFHCLVPARRWWDDIVYTCTTMNLFLAEDHVERWLGGREPGKTTSLAKLGELANAWWVDRLDAGWQPHTREQNQAILDRLGLHGDFWQLAEPLPVRPLLYH